MYTCCDVRSFIRNETFGRNRDLGNEQISVSFRYLNSKSWTRVLAKIDGECNLRNSVAIAIAISESEYWEDRHMRLLSPSPSAAERLHRKTSSTALLCGDCKSIRDDSVSYSSKMLVMPSWFNVPSAWRRHGFAHPSGALLFRFALHLSSRRSCHFALFILKCVVSVSHGTFAVNEKITIFLLRYSRDLRTCIAPVLWNSQDDSKRPVA